MSALPAVRFALPGRWVKADLDDDSAVAALTDLLPDDQDRGGAWLESLRAAGAQTVLLRPQSTPVTVIVFIWPTGHERGDATTDGLRARVGLEGDVVPHEAGYSVVRHRGTAGSSQDVVTYALAHPDTGRVLVVRCTAVEGSFEDYMIRDFDLAAGDLTWIET